MLPPMVVKLQTEHYGPTYKWNSMTFRKIMKNPWRPQPATQTGFYYLAALQQSAKPAKEKPQQLPLLLILDLCHTESYTGIHQQQCSSPAPKAQAWNVYRTSSNAELNQPSATEILLGCRDTLCLPCCLLHCHCVFFTHLTSHLQSCWSPQALRGKSLKCCYLRCLLCI